MSLGACQNNWTLGMGGGKLLAKETRAGTLFGFNGVEEIIRNGKWDHLTHQEAVAQLKATIFENLIVKTD